MNASDPIEVLTAIEAVRRRPGMYLDLNNPELGSQLALQTLCHAVDEAIDHRCSQVSMHLGPGQGEVWYDAGMPLAEDEASPGQTVAHVFLGVHYGCHSRKKHLEVGDELCAIGLAIFNAICRQLTVEIAENGRSLTLHFVEGKLLQESAIQPTDKADFTRLRYALDTSLLPGIRAEESALRRTLARTRELVPQLDIQLDVACA